MVEIALARIIHEACSDIKAQAKLATSSIFMSNEVDEVISVISHSSYVELRLKRGFSWLRLS